MPAAEPARELATPPSLGLKDLVLWVLRRRRRFRVQGDSMLPALKPGDHVFVAPRQSVAVGDIVVARHPFKTDVVLIKRVFAVADGMLDLRSDGVGTDSRTLGQVPLGLAFGPVVARVG